MSHTIRTLDLLIIPKDGILLWKPAAAAAAAYTCAYCIYRGGVGNFCREIYFLLNFRYKNFTKIN